jgi:hypothetical protein
MSKAVWIINLPESTKVRVKENQIVSADEVLAENDQKEINAPADGKIIEVSDGKIKFEFETLKISGQSLIDKHVWGRLIWSPKINYSQLNSQYQQKIIATGRENLTSHFLSKARTLGVSGIIAFSEEEKEVKSLKKALIPILVVDKKNKNLIKNKDGVKCLLNAGKNCLLVPDTS